MSDSKAEKMQYMTDEQLLAEFASERNAAVQEYLLGKYKNLVLTQARRYFLVGAQTDDLIQEGMIALYKAIEDFEPGYGKSFLGFAKLCIQRRMISAVKGAMRHKHSPLNGYISLDKNVYDDGNGNTLGELTPDQNEDNPEGMMIRQEEYQRIISALETRLSPLEQKVIRHYLDGLNYREIAAELKSTPKSVDNALQRIKNKLAGLFDE